MKFSFVHNNINVFDLDNSTKFYGEALGMKEVRRNAAADGSFILVFMKGDGSGQELELTWLRDKNTPYNLGDNEVHMAFATDDMEGALKKHKEMGSVVYENKEMGIYFIADPDGYWTEIVPR
jgi:lactoylglutathione lyase